MTQQVKSSSASIRRITIGLILPGNAVPPDNLKTLRELAVIDADLRERVTVILSASSAHVADRIAMLATDRGLPLTADEFRDALTTVAKMVVVPDTDRWLH